MGWVRQGGEGLSPETPLERLWRPLQGQGGQGTGLGPERPLSAPQGQGSRSRQGKGGQDGTRALSGALSGT